MSPYVYVYIAVIVVLCATAVFCFVFFGKRDKKRKDALKEKAKIESVIEKNEPQVSADAVKNYEEAIEETPQPAKDLPDDAFENYVWKTENPKAQATGRRGAKLNPFDFDDDVGVNKDEPDDDDFDDIDEKFREYEEFLRKNLQFDDNPSQTSDDEMLFDYDEAFGTGAAQQNGVGNHNGVGHQNQSVDEIVTNLPPKARDVVLSDKISAQSKKNDGQKLDTQNNTDGQGE